MSTDTILGISLSSIIYIGFVLAAIAVKRKYEIQAREDEIHAAMLRDTEEREEHSDTV